MVLCVHHPSQVSFHHRLSPFTLVCLPTPFPSGNHHTAVCVCELFIFYFLLNLFTSFTRLPTCSPLTVVSLCSVPVSKDGILT